MATWRGYPRRRVRRTVVGTLKLLKGVRSPQLGNRRDLLAYLPPSYGSTERRYPVLYMQDGQNLFDEATSFAGEWQVDETMEALSSEGLEAIVIGIPNMGERRLAEYTPFPDPEEGGGDGDRYLAFLVETVKPIVDRDWRTLPEREHTGILGSSLGGSISLYAFFRHPRVFGCCGALSPALEVGGTALVDFVRSQPHVGGCIYLDVGTREAEGLVQTSPKGRAFSRRYLATVREMRDLLTEKGYRQERDLLYVEEKGGIHHESAWARRLPNALRFLLKR